MQENQISQQKQELKQTVNGETLIQVKFKGSNNYQISFKEIKGSFNITLSSPQNIFSQWTSNINLDEELSKQSELKDLCEGITLSKFQQILINLIQTDYYSIDEIENQNVLLNFTLFMKKWKKEMEIKKSFKFELKKQNLIQDGEQNQSFIKIANLLQDRIISLENENKDLKEQLSLMFKHQNSSIEELREYEKNPCVFRGISQLINTYELIKTIQDFLPDNFKTKKAKLLYRASVDGYDTEDFHDKTDNKGPLLFVIKEYYDGILYGGFCPDDNPFSNQGYKSSTYIYSDQGPFIFNLSDKIKSSLKPGKQEYSYYGSRSNGPKMGEYDIFVSNGKKFNITVGRTYVNNLEGKGYLKYQDYEVFGF